MRPRRLRHPSAIAAPRVTVRGHVAWPVRAVIVAVIVLVAIGAGVWIGRIGPSWLGLEPLRDRLAETSRENESLRRERDELRAKSTSTSSQAVMERSTVAALGEQIARLEEENARLKEDVAFFEAATADRSRISPSSAVAIRRFQVVPDPKASAARYRVLLTQDSRATADFKGELRLLVTLQRNGKAVSIDLPVAGPASAAGGNALEADGVHVDGDPSQFQILFRSYKRLDGSFRFPADAQLRAVEIRIVDRGTVLARQAVSLG